MRSFTGTKPRRSVSAPMADSPRPLVYGARPVATSTASTSSVSTTSFVPKSVSSTVQGFVPGTPAVTLLASTLVWKSMGRVSMSVRFACTAARTHLHSRRPLHLFAIG